MQFPDDENGEVLRSLADSGVDLTLKRPVDFAHRAPDQSTAEAFAEQARRLGFAVDIYEPDEESLEEGDTEFDVICTREMVPTHAELTRIETQLATLAHQHGCREDGWGFMS